MTEREKSVGWVVAMVMLVIAAFGWAFMAAGYAHSEQGWRRGVEDTRGPMTVHKATRTALADFFSNALRQIPNSVSVLGFAFKHQIWLPVLILVLEILVGIGGYKMKQLEESLNRPVERRRSR